MWLRAYMLVDETFQENWKVIFSTEFIFKNDFNLEIILRLKLFPNLNKTVNVNKTDLLIVCGTKWIFQLFNLKEHETKITNEQ